MGDDGEAVKHQRLGEISEQTQADVGNGACDDVVNVVVVAVEMMGCTPSGRGEAADALHQILGIKWNHKMVR